MIQTRIIGKPDNDNTRIQTRIIGKPVFIYFDNGHHNAWRICHGAMVLYGMNGSRKLSAAVLFFLRICWSYAGGKSACRYPVAAILLRAKLKCSNFKFQIACVNEASFCYLKVLMVPIRRCCDSSGAGVRGLCDVSSSSRRRKRPDRHQMTISSSSSRRTVFARHQTSPPPSFDADPTTSRQGVHADRSSDLKRGSLSPTLRQHRDGRLSVQRCRHRRR